MIRPHIGLVGVTMMLRAMKKATLWINAAALVLIWGSLLTGFVMFGKVPLLQVLMVGLLASLMVVFVLTVLVRLSFYFAITIRAYRRGELTPHRDARRWFLVTLGCVAYIVLGLSTLPFMRLPETINTIFVLTAGCAFLAMLVLTYAFLESLTLSVRQAIAIYEETLREDTAKTLI